ncbi:MAG: c-type cytochrome [Candidatus Promineifilaceae bacterium]|nr:c-type cytochrome [Candidatus Promineifilaceae bacterium]
MCRRKALRIGCGLLVGPIVLALLIFGYAQLRSEARLQRHYDVTVETVAIPTDDEALTRGRRLVVTGRCTECHGQRLSGEVVSADASIGRIYASNLTSGRGGVGQHYTDEDWIRAIRHGIGQDGRSLIVTPAQYYYYLSDEDLGAIIAYLKSLPPVDNELPSPSVGPLTRFFLVAADMRDWLPAEKIDHRGPRPAAPPPAISSQYGQYLLRIKACLGCHSVSDLSAAPGGALAEMSLDEFVYSARFSQDRSMSINTRPLTDEELEAIWLYLRQLPPDQQDIR